MNYNQGSIWRRWDLHVHTASSYDYKYEGENPNEALINVLKSNNISVVAITDHFVIDKNRINELRAAAPEIVFFPGVELRTDKGDTNIHVILIFDEKTNLDHLSIDFDAFKRGEGKFIDNNDKIFWDYSKIVEFAKKHSAIISVHAGSKTNGIDKQISNLLPENIATKEDYAKTVDIFEGGNINKDIREYEKYKFPKYGKKPLIFCSDNHNPMKYEPAAPCWIKADPTFEGLKQVINEPERVFIGEKPDLLQKMERAPQKFIKGLSINKKESSTLDEIWYKDFELEINPGLVAIIGNKGSGKSAIADIVGLCSNACVNKNKVDNLNRHNNAWSFLTKEKFRRPNPDRSKEFEAKVTWADGSCSDVVSLNMECDESKPERVRYIPQNFLETLCTTEEEDTFEAELKSIIFQYLPQEQKNGNENLEEVIASMSIEYNRSEETIISLIKEQNTKIIELESKKKPEYKKTLENALALKNEELENLIKVKPKEVEKPVPGNGNDQSLQKSVDDLSKELDAINGKINTVKQKFGENSIKIGKAQQEKEVLSRLKEYVGKIKDSNRQLLEDIGLNIDDVIIINSNEEIVDKKIEELNRENQEFQESLNPNQINSLEAKRKEILNNLQEKKNKLGEADRLYQKYLEDLERWKTHYNEIKGNIDTPKTILFYENQIKYVNDFLENDLNSAIEERINYVDNLIEKKKKILDIYEYLYSPIEQFIESNKKLLKDFPIEMKSSFVFNNLYENFFDFINQGLAGTFCGKDAGLQKLKNLCEAVDFSKNDSIINFVKQLNNSLLKDYRDGREIIRDVESQLKKGHTKQEIYDYIYSLSYIKPFFKLQMSKKDLSLLSPGERGAILLLFYLFIDNDDKPLIIDQPEENLDNYSIFKYLVSFIMKAKKKRQIIMITHNPNLAVVCDADQIIKMDIAKDNKNTVSYKSGSIENPEINQCIVDVLEGTYPAFNNRNRKYLDKE